MPSRNARLREHTPGSGVADDKLVHSYVDRIVRFYLGEEPLLPSVPSYDLAERRSAEVLEQLVVKPRGEMGGEGVVIWRAADAETRTRVWREIERDPAAFVGQELVTLSVHPTVCDGRLEPRHVDLRPYAVLRGRWGPRSTRGHQPRGARARLDDRQQRAGAVAPRTPGYRKAPSGAHPV